MGAKFDAAESMCAQAIATILSFAFCSLCLLDSFASSSLLLTISLSLFVFLDEHLFPSFGS